jgi:MoxR-like ATPase
LRGKIAWGASPRASIALERCARAAAWLAGRDYVMPEDIQALAPDVLRHRVLLGYEAEAEGLRVDDVVKQLLERVPLP